MIRVLSFLYWFFELNLVPNPSFEEFKRDICGLSVSVKQFETDNCYWKSPTMGKPNIYSRNISRPCWNAISPTDLDQPKSGNRMAMICTFGQSGFRSYLEVKLVEPLKRGREYTAKLWVKIPSTSTYVYNSIGYLFLKEPIQSETVFNIRQTPQVQFDPFLSDTTQWISLEKKFALMEECQYLIIGNFSNNDSSKVEKVRMVERETGIKSFLFIDDVQVLKK